MNLTHLTRRHFLHCTAALLPSIGWHLSPRRRNLWFVARGGDAWPVADASRWCIENRSLPILERASQGLQQLTSRDGDRIIRLVTRRCGLNLVETSFRGVVVHHWSRQGLADLRPFFKAKRLARCAVPVVIRDRKRETSVMVTGDEFLYGWRLSRNWPAETFRRKWRRRFEAEWDDLVEVPATRAGYAWEGVQPNRIPWKALKSAWRRLSPGECPNCGGATLLVNFGDPWVSMFRRQRWFLHACCRCRRCFHDDTVPCAQAWMVASLDADCLPDFEMVWGRPAPISWNA